MENKTIGGFISTLRKANGMTQKDLAEKLHISDKTVSRWERDEGVPDLSLIPVIAEIFDITCDELLRGERKSPEERSIDSPKGEKQRKRILSVGLSNYKTGTFITIGISLAGLLAALIANSGFNHAFVGFFLAAIFYLCSVLCQFIFINRALLAVQDDKLASEKLGEYKYSVVRYAAWSIGFTTMLFGFSLPLVLHPSPNEYVLFGIIFSAAPYGIKFSSWLLYGSIFGFCAWVIFTTGSYFLYSFLLKKKFFHLGEKEMSKLHYRHSLKKKCAIVLILFLAFTALAQGVANMTCNPYTLADGTVFKDYDSFVAYMEKERSFPWQKTAVIDYYGGPFRVESLNRSKLFTRELTDRKGNIVCQYHERNESVRAVRYKERDGSLLPITVISHDEFKAAQKTVDIIKAVFHYLYTAEIFILSVVYLYKYLRDKNISL